MIVHRLGKSRYGRDLSGRGAEKAGGRWNNKGVRLVYTSSSIALSLAELAVHLPFGIVPSDYSQTSVLIPDTVRIFELPVTHYPGNWQDFPHPPSTRALGDMFVQEGKYAVLKVLSSVVPMEYNYLINPLHRDASKIKVVDVSPYRFDPRLFKR